MPANVGQTLRCGGSIHNAIKIRSSSPAFLTAPTVNSSDSSDSSDSETWEGFSNAEDHYSESDTNTDSDINNDSDNKVIPKTYRTLLISGLKGKGLLWYRRTVVIVRTVLKTGVNTRNIISFTIVIVNLN